MDASDEDDSYSLITCGPGSLASKLLVGVVDVKESPRGATTYVLRCSVVKSELEWLVERRYSEFAEVRQALHDFFSATRVFQCFGCRWFAHALRFFRFPRRRVLSSRSKRSIRKRKVELHQFACLLAAHTFSSVPKCTRCSQRIFGRVRDFFSLGANVSHPSSAAAIAQALQPQKFAPISDPSKSKLEFRRRQGIYKVVQAEKAVFSKRCDYPTPSPKQPSPQPKVELSQLNAPREGRAPTLLRNSSIESGVPTVSDDDDDDRRIGGGSPQLPAPPRLQPGLRCQQALEPPCPLPPALLFPSLLL